MSVNTLKNAQFYFDLADIVMVIIRSDEVVADVNKKACEFLGYPKDEIVGKNWFDSFVPAESRDAAKRVFHSTLSGQLRHVHYEHPVATKLHGERIINWHSILATDEAGRTIGLLNSASDVTERRQAEKAAKQVETRLQISLDSMLEGCQIIDQDWRYVYLNEAAAQQGRRNRKELVGRTMMEMYPGIEQTELFQHLQDCMKNRISHRMENLFSYPDGSKGWFELRIEPVPEGILILSWDITKRKEMEAEMSKYHQRLEEVVAERTAEYTRANEKLVQEIEERKKTEEGLKLRVAILDNAREAIFLINLKGDFVYANESACRIYGYSRDELLNMNLRQLLQPSESHVAEARLKEIAEKGQLDLETVHARKDKSLMPVKVHHSMIRTAHGSFIVSVIRDFPAKQ